MERGPRHRDAGRRRTGLIPGAGKALGTVGGEIAGKFAPTLAGQFFSSAGSGSRRARSAAARRRSSTAPRALTSRVGSAGARLLNSGPGRVLTAPFRAIANLGTKAGQATRRGIDSLRTPRGPVPAQPRQLSAPSQTTAPQQTPARPGNTPAQQTPHGQQPAPPRFVVDKAGNTLDRTSVANRISTQKQGRHVLGAREYGRGQGGSYFNSADDAQKVLDAFHNGTAEVVEVATRGGHIKVRVPGVTGTNVNASAGFPNQPTNTFLIKGTSKVSVVPTAP